MKEWTPLRISYEWEPIEVAPGKLFACQSPLTKAFVDSYSKPALYRWVFRGQSGVISAAYIGEAENLAQRVQGYIWPGRTQQTNLRMKDEFLKHMSSGGAVELQILRFEPFGINNVNVFHESQLGNPYIRKMMENFLLADHDRYTANSRTVWRIRLRGEAENPRVPLVQPDRNSEISRQLWLPPRSFEKKEKFK